ncbi:MULTISPECIES: transposase family protein [Microcystis]|uniref:Transposase family protein n=1 Tax=Microcystis wesenbergii NRERC-220 TaxID=3068991 RepID=A0ABU3HRA1_9CHRO|nr:transposase family protein [Microcystis wesenbergii]MDT3677072.1 transposase family protein [Microcystis wesenbergii NRERC-220]
MQEQEDLIGGIPAQIPVLVDSGFQGVQKQYVNIRLPHKKPKGGELTAEQKQENRELAKERVVGENAFSGVKRYRAVSDIYRNRVANFDAQLILTACGLWNFYGCGSISIN